MKASRFVAMLGAIVGIAGAAAAQSPGELDSSLSPQEGLTQNMLHGDPWTDILAKVDGRVGSRPVQALPPIDCDTCH